MITYSDGVVLRNDGTDPSTLAKDLNAAVATPVTVRVATLPTPGQGAVASIFDINGGAISNPFNTDDNGNFTFKAASGFYDVIVDEGGMNIIDPSVDLFGGETVNDISVAYEFATVALFKASLIEFPDGKTIRLLDRGADFTKMSGNTLTLDLNVIYSTSVSQSIDLIENNGKWTAQALGVLTDGSDQTATMQAIGDIITGKTVIFSAGTYVMAAVQWSTKSGFTLEFTGNPVFKLLDGANTFCFRLSVCSNFGTKGRLLVDGNKANNPTFGGSSAGGANGTFVLSGASNDFHIDYIKCINAWTNGVSFDSCSDFTAGTLIGDDSERRGVTIKDCSDFVIETIRAKNATQNTPFYVLGSSGFMIDSIKGSGSTASNAVLFETGNTDFSIGKIQTDSCFSGTKIEDNTLYSIESIISNGTTSAIGVTVNGGEDWAIGSILSTSSGDAGVALLTAESPLKRGHIGSINTKQNGAEGIIVQTTGSNAFESVIIDSIQALSNTNSNLLIDGAGGAFLPISGQLTIGEWISGTPAVGKFDIEVTDLSLFQRGKPNIGDGYYTTNYSDPFTLDTSTTPDIKDFLKFNNVAQTVNVGATTITRWDGWIGDNRIFYILIQDNNTTFANGTGTGRILVQGASVATALGEMWQATYANDIWYMHKIS